MSVRNETAATRGEGRRSHRLGLNRQFRTRRLLGAAFGILLVAFVTVLVFETVVFHRIGKSFAEVKSHEDEMRLALQIGDAVRDQHAHAAHFALTSDSSSLQKRRSSRDRATSLIEQLAARVDEPHCKEWMAKIREAQVELERAFDVEVLPAVLRGDREAALLHDRGYELVSVVEENVERLFASLQDTTTTFHRQLMESESRAVRWTIGMLLAMPLIIGLFISYLSRSITRPLMRLSEGAAAVAAGDLDARIDITTPDEFGAVAADFNAMTIALKDHQRKLVESEKLAGIGRVAGGIAHEINNPLQVLIGYLSMHRDEQDPRLAAHLAAAEEEAHRCKSIVEGLLELSRPAPTPETVDLRALCDDVAMRIGPGGSPVTRVVVDGEALAVGDRDKLRQVLFNLIKNGVEAAGPSGTVKVAVGHSEWGVEVAVTDTGPGVTPEARPRLFEPFFTTKASGCGLGLAVSRAIALRHGGDIRSSNDGASGGAVFTLRLPSLNHLRE